MMSIFLMFHSNLRAIGCLGKTSGPVPCNKESSVWVYKMDTWSSLIVQEEDYHPACNIGKLDIHSLTSRWVILCEFPSLLMIQRFNNFVHMPGFDFSHVCTKIQKLQGNLLWGWSKKPQYLKNIFDKNGIILLQNIDIQQAQPSASACYLSLAH